MLTLHLFFVTVTISVRKKDMTYSRLMDERRIANLYETNRDKMISHLSL